MSIIGFTIAKHKLKIKEMSMENQRDYEAEAKALRFKKGLSDKALSKIAAKKKYNEANKVFIRKKGKYNHKIDSLKIEIFEHIIQQWLIHPDKMTDFFKCKMYEIDNVEKDLRALLRQKAEERYKFKKK